MRNKATVTVAHTGGFLSVIVATGGADFCEIAESRGHSTADYVFQAWSVPSELQGKSTIAECVQRLSEMADNPVAHTAIEFAMQVGLINDLTCPKPVRVAQTVKLHVLRAIRDAGADGLCNDFCGCSASSIETSGCVADTDCMGCEIAWTGVGGADSDAPGEEFMYPSREQAERSKRENAHYKKA